MTSEEPTLTIAISNYNHSRFLPAMLDSLLIQSYQPLELLLVDDASTDDSARILRDYAQRHPVIELTLNERNRGAVANYVDLLNRARGRYFMGVAADDVILPGFLEKSMAILREHPSAGLCSCLSRLIDKDGRDLGLFFPNPFPSVRSAHYIDPQEVSRRFLKRGPWIEGNTAIYRTEALIAAGGFRPDLRSFADGFVMQVIALTHGVCFVPEPLAAWRRMPEGFSGKTIATPSIACELADRAAHFMETEYRPLFSPQYVKKWRSRWDCSFLVAFSEVKEREWLAGVRLLLDHRGSSSGIRGILTLAIGSVAKFAKGLAAVRFRWFDLGWYIRDRIRGSTRP